MFVICTEIKGEKYVSLKEFTDLQMENHCLKKTIAELEQDRWDLNSILDTCEHLEERQNLKISQLHEKLKKARDRIDALQRKICQAF